METSSPELPRGTVTFLFTDEVIAFFERPRDALRAAVTFRDALPNEPWIPSELRRGVRIAVHSGRVVDPARKYLGVVRTPPDEARRSCGCVADSRVARDGGAPRGELPDVPLRDLGDVALRNFEPARVYEVAS